MRNVTYINGKVLQGNEFQSGLAVVVSDTKIVKVIPDELIRHDNTETVDLDGNYFAPGFIDTQVNGGDGILFNDSPSIKGIRTIAKAHRQFGTTSLLPTLISDDISVIQKGVNAVNSAIEEGVPGIRGIHIEGPFLNLDRRGIHNPDKIKKLTQNIMRELEPVRNGCSLLTIAPETVQPCMIGQLVEKGFVISAGHSNACYEEISDAIAHGLSGFTHLFNAMSQLGVREPGVVGAALDHMETWSGVIADGHHVSPISLKIAYRCKGAEKLMLVTDAMPPVGSDKSEFFLLGKHITVKDGVCIDASGTLAGAALDMMSAVRNMMTAVNCGLAQACVMASASPAAFLGLQHKFGSIKAGMQADFVVIDEQFNLLETIMDGDKS